MSTLTGLLGVGGGGGGTPINGMAQFANAPVLYTDLDGNIWLEAGNVSTDTATYPDALVSSLDVSTASYASKSFSVAAQEGNPYGLAFNTDGTIMFIVGDSNDTVYQYTLTIGFDISTASYAGKSFSVSSQEIYPKSITFNTDGTIMFIVGTSNNTVYQYTLTTGFDVSTASYASKSFSVATQDTSPKSVKFNTDGTIMFIVGDSNDTVYQYTLTTGFDVSTASYASKSFSVSSQEIYPQSIEFNTDGTIMFTVGRSNDTVYQYTLDPLSLGLASTTGLDSDTYVRIK